jgi:hypothetical protein
LRRHIRPAAPPEDYDREFDAGWLGLSPFAAESRRIPDPASKFSELA